MKIRFRVIESSGTADPRQTPIAIRLSQALSGFLMREEIGFYGFLRLVWRLWKWFRKVKKQAHQLAKQRAADKSNYVFRTSQVLTIETEN